MRSIKIRLSDLENPNMIIPIGKVGEHLATRVIIDCGGIYKDYPYAAVGLTVRPMFGEAFPAVVSRDDDKVIWDVANTCLTQDGEGEIQLSFTANEVLLRSFVGKTITYKSLLPVGEVPDAIADFLVQAEAAITLIPETINQALQEAKDSGEFDGFSPIATVTRDGREITISIQDVNGTTSETYPVGTYDYEELDNKPHIPEKVSDLQNDAGYLTTETDPTVPAWAKAPTKPTYTKSEVGLSEVVNERQYSASYPPPHDNTKADKVVGATFGHFPVLDELGNLMDSGKNPGDFLTEADIVNKIDKSEKGAANGVAELDQNGKVLSSQLPSYVDDVVEYQNRNAFPYIGEAGKIYIAIDTNLTYRWTGSTYVAISSPIALGETANTAYRGDRGKIAYDTALRHETEKADKTDTVLNTTLSRGRKAWLDVGQGSFAFGEEIEASGVFSHGEGINTTAYGAASHAEGSSSKAMGGYSHAEGLGTFACGEGSHASGRYSYIDSWDNILEWQPNTPYRVGDKCKVTWTRPGAGVVVATQLLNDDGNMFTTDLSAFSVGDVCKIRGTIGYYNNGGTLIGTTDITNTFTFMMPRYEYTVGEWTIIVDLNAHFTLEIQYAHGAINIPPVAETQNDGYHSIGILKINPENYRVSYYRCCKATNGTPYFSNDYSIFEEITEMMTFAETIGNGHDITSRSNARSLDWWGNERLMGDLYVHCDGDSTGGVKVASISDLPTIATIPETQAIIDEFGRNDPDQVVMFDTIYGYDEETGAYYYETEADAVDIAAAFMSGESVCVHLPKAVENSSALVFGNIEAYLQLEVYQPAGVYAGLSGYEATNEEFFGFSNSFVATEFNSSSGNTVVGDIMYVTSNPDIAHGKIRFYGTNYSYVT